MTLHNFLDEILPSSRSDNIASHILTRTARSRANYLLFDRKPYRTAQDAAFSVARFSLAWCSYTRGFLEAVCSGSAPPLPPHRPRRLLLGSAGSRCVGSKRHISPAKRMAASPAEKPLLLRLHKDRTENGLSEQCQRAAPFVNSTPHDVPNATNLEGKHPMDSSLCDL
jgi:hypothetical protein